jgi:hypothetical protein
VTLKDAGGIILFLDFIGALWLTGLLWIDLRQQTSDIGRVGGVVMLIAAAYALFAIGRALLGV